MPIFQSAILLSAVLIAAPLLAQQSTPDAPGTPPTPSAPAAPAQELPDSPDTQAHVSPQPTGPTVIFDTSMGKMTCRLFDKEAPEAEANFVGLATGTKAWTDPATKQKEQGKPFYDGTTFHRVIPGFMIQGGDPLGTGEGDPGYMFKDEFDPNLNFDVAGRLAMANSGPDTNGSQFFITVTPQPHLDQHYTIFGQCDDPSVLVAQSITQVNRDSNDRPLDPVLLRKVTVIPAGQPVPGASSVAAPSSSAPAPRSAPSASGSQSSPGSGPGSAPQPQF